MKAENFKCTRCGGEYKLEVVYAPNLSRYCPLCGTEIVPNWQPPNDPLHPYDQK